MEMIAKMVGRTIENEYPPRAHFVGEPLLEVRNLNTSKLHNINFTLHKGEILGLVGLVGAGRTEIIRAIYGADKVKSKELIMEGIMNHLFRRKNNAEVGVVQAKVKRPPETVLEDQI